MKKKELKQSIKVDMKYFLEIYYGITNQELLNNLIKMSHKDIKEILSLYGIEITRTCFQTITREMIAVGDVILVTDGFGNIAPYNNPLILNDIIEINQNKKEKSYVKKR